MHSKDFFLARVIRSRGLSYSVRSLAAVPIAAARVVFGCGSAGTFDDLRQFIFARHCTLRRIPPKPVIFSWRILQRLRRLTYYDDKSLIFVPPPRT